MPNPNHRPERDDSLPWRTRWIIQCEEVRVGREWVAVQAESTLIVDGRIDLFLPGDIIEVYGEVRRIPAPSNPGAFDLQEYFGRDGRFVALSADGVDQLKLIGQRRGYLLQRWRGLAVRGVDQSLRRWVTHGQAPLAAALVFGQREQVDWEDKQELMATGTLHMLAISGMHVEIVAWGVLVLCGLAGFGDRTRLALLIVVCGLYAALADGKPPVLRAVILVVAFALARCMGRKARLYNVLSLAAVILFVLQATHIEDVGVHLSFLAVASIGLFVLGDNPAKFADADRLGRFVKSRRRFPARLVHRGAAWLVAGLHLSFWVWLITCPLIWCNFHVVAPVAVPLNVIVAIPLAISLLAGLTAAALGWLPLLGWGSGEICGAGLDAICRLIHVGKSIPGGHLWLPEPPGWWVVGFYGFIALWLLVFGLRPTRLAGICAACLVGWRYLDFCVGAPRLSVGPGNCACGNRRRVPVNVSRRRAWDERDSRDARRTGLVV